MDGPWNRPKSIQGSIWCPGCSGSKQKSYFNFQGNLVTIPCPLCKGTGLDSYKGKIHIAMAKQQQARIIITQNLQECILLHRHVGDIEWEKSFDRKMFPADPKPYSATWYWRFDDNGKLTGQSGNGAFPSTLALAGPGAQSYPVNDYIKLTPAKEDK